MNASFLSSSGLKSEGIYSYEAPYGGGGKALSVKTFSKNVLKSEIAPFLIQSLKLSNLGSVKLGIKLGLNNKAFGPSNSLMLALKF